MTHPEIVLHELFYKREITQKVASKHGIKSLKSNISKLRKQGFEIKTVIGFGYRIGIMQWLKLAWMRLCGDL